MGSSTDIQVKSKERVQKHGEVFTPIWVVNDMLNLLPNDCWKPGKTFLEPACGEGAFLIEIYKRKLQNITAKLQVDWEWQVAIATSSIYGIELLEDNTNLCKQNLIHVFTIFYDKHFPDTQDEEFTKTIHFLIEHNIVQGNSLTYRKCKLSCENECKKCEPIVFSQWIPVGGNKGHLFIRKDYTYEGIVNADRMRKAASGWLFEEEFSNCEYGLVKEYKSVIFKKIKYATN